MQPQSKKEKTYLLKEIRIENHQHLKGPVYDEFTFITALKIHASHSSEDVLSGST